MEIDSNDGMLLVATTLGFPVADPCLCLASAFGIALVLLAVGPCFCLGPTLDTALAIDFGMDPRPTGVVVAPPGDGTFMMDVHCGSGTKDNKPDSMHHCSKTSTHVVLGCIGTSPILLKTPEHLYVLGIWGINAWEEFRMCAGDEGCQGFDVWQ